MNEPDKLKALILLRKKTMRVPTRDLADIVGITRQTMARMLNDKATETWRFGDLLAVCQALEIGTQEFVEAISYERRKE